MEHAFVAYFVSDENIVEAALSDLKHHMVI